MKFKLSELYINAHHIFGGMQTIKANKVLSVEETDTKVTFTVAADILGAVFRLPVGSRPYRAIFKAPATKVNTGYGFEIDEISLQQIERVSRRRNAEENVIEPELLESTVKKYRFTMNGLSVSVVE